MLQSFTLPAMPRGTPDVVVLRWFVRPGQAFRAGDPLLVVVNDQIELALPAPDDGVLDAVLIDEGAAAAAGVALAQVALAPRASAEPEPRAPRCTPVARRLAAAHALDLAGLQGSGAGGRIVKRDVLAALPESPQPPISRLPSPVPGLPSPVSRLPSPVSRLPSPVSLTHSLTAVEADWSAVERYCAQNRATFERRGLALEPVVCVALVIASLLRRHPLLQARWSDDGLVVRRRVHLQIDRGGGPASLVPDAQDLNLRGIARALARPGDAEPTSAGLATFAIVAGCDGMVWSGPAERPVAVLTLGAARRQAGVVEQGGVERVVVRPAALLTLTYDARVLDQAQADAFLCDLRRAVEQFAPA